MFYYMSIAIQSIISVFRETYGPTLGKFRLLSPLGHHDPVQFMVRSMYRQKDRFLQSTIIWQSINNGIHLNCCFFNTI